MLQGKRWNGRSVAVIGQATGKEGGRPWNGNTASSKRLYRWLGCRGWEEFDGGFYAMNVARYAGKKGKGDDYELDPRRMAVAWRLSLDADLVILVGRVAQKAALGTAEPKMLWQFGKFIGVPHPSGVNHQLNDGGDARVQRFLRRRLRAR